MMDKDKNPGEKVSFRIAERKDCGLILQFVKELADYEKMSDEVTATEEMFQEWIFDKHAAEVIFIMENGREAGFALYFYNFSTFVGRAGLYLEDIFVKPEFRGKGYGKALLDKLADIAIEKGCGRFEWVCLDWNEPSIRFYRSMGARPMSEWTIYRLDGEALRRRAANAIGNEYRCGG
jgi:GNAT superfamily N-acetyltransferase